MGAFRSDCRIENHINRKRSARVTGLLVDTGSEHTWISGATLRRIGVPAEKKDVAFVMANGQTVTRDVGFAVLRVGNHFTIDEVVFADEGDLQLLGARTLEGLNLTVDPRRKKLVAAGPRPAAATAIRRAPTSSPLRPL
jgi:predicted aspartyl protease